MTEHPEVVHVLLDTYGGVPECARNMLTHCARSDGPHNAVLVRPELAEVTPIRSPLPADSLARLTHRLPQENLYAVLDRLHALLPPGPGVLVCHDWLELAAAHHYDPERIVVQVLHGDMDYYYALAERHRGVVDRFVTVSKACETNLRALLPDRVDDIHRIPYGVDMDVPVRQASPGPLRLCFCGRLDHGHKGVLDLPEIDAGLRERGADVVWTVIGNGPDEARLRDAWRNDDVRWLGRRSNAEVRDLLSKQDVFVLPTRNEGFPVALIEAMGAGLVPVVSNIDSGVPEVVHEGRTGLRPPVGDIQGFVNAIARLADDRALVEAMSRRARDQVQETYDVQGFAKRWDAVFTECLEHPRRPWRRTTVPYGSRLDHPWLPNAFVRCARRLRAGRRVEASVIDPQA